MTRDQAERVLARACSGKTSYGVVLADAVAAAFDSDNATAKPVRKYRCPVCSEWHVGHTPTLDALRSIAEAMRVLSGYTPGEHIARQSKRDRRRERHARPVEA